MLELYFVLYRIPKMMSQLARERGRSPVAWSFIGIGAWIGAELAVSVTVVLVYAILVGFDDSADGIPPGVSGVAYVVSLVGAIIAVSLVRRVLRSQPQHDFELPPPPPTFLNISSEKQNY